MKQGFFGVKNAHIAFFTDEDKFEYDDPVPIPGAVAISMTPSVNESNVYADNEVWLKGKRDTGGSGTMSFYDVYSTEDLRRLIAKAVGWTVTTGGQISLDADTDPEPFAFLCEQPGSVVGRRRCLYKCELSKPADTMNTLSENPDITQLDFDFTWVPVTLPKGRRTSGYDSFTGMGDYDHFFDEVNVARIDKPANGNNV